VEKLVEKMRIFAIILFGSRVRGDWGPWSDYDILVVGEFEEPYLERIGRILEILSEISLPIEPHPYTLDEIKEMLLKGNPLVVDALEEGRPLYVTERFREVEELFWELKRKGLRRSSTSIILPKQEE